ncbi:MAG: hypothetical protein JKX85_10090 [Phycisphaeraceae bacterium]|nr:hypothetical protein [Phycisphaeraceae bacterium]
MMIANITHTMQAHWIPGQVTERDDQGRAIARQAAQHAPPLLTESEAVRMFRFDEDAPIDSDGRAAYRKLHNLKDKLRPCKIGTSLRYPLAQVLQCINQMTDPDRV